MYNRSSRDWFFLPSDLKKVTVRKKLVGSNFIFLDYGAFFGLHQRS
jgi:hypothetical protein